MFDITDASLLWPITKPHGAETGKPCGSGRLEIPGYRGKRFRQWPIHYVRTLDTLSVDCFLFCYALFCYVCLRHNVPSFSSRLFYCLSLYSLSTQRTKVYFSFLFSPFLFLPDTTGLCKSLSLSLCVPFFLKIKSREMHERGNNGQTAACATMPNL